MSAKSLFVSYEQKKHSFLRYVERIKRNSHWDIYTIVNTTLINNPYTTEFPKNFFTDKKKYPLKLGVFFVSLLIYYTKNFLLYFFYLIEFIIYRIEYQKPSNILPKVLIDIFGLVDKTNKDGCFSDSYLTGVYEEMRHYNVNYSILIRPYNTKKNPFKLQRFFRIINQSQENFLFEYEFLTFFDFVHLLYLIFIYPLKVLRLLQKEEDFIDRCFNYALLKDIRKVNIEGFTRFILGKNIANLQTVNTIYSWSEFQVLERGFNFGVRTNNSDITLIGLQFFLNYETYFNSKVDDLDYDMRSSYHKVLVNGKHFILNRTKVKYALGVSLRYKELFNFSGVQEEKNILLLGSYVESDTKFMLKSIYGFQNVIFKNHPAVQLQNLGKLPKNIELSNKNIYELFKHAQLVVATASGTAIEAAACGLSVIIIASQDFLTANPFADVGKGEIWDVAFDISDVDIVYTKLIEYRKSNKARIQELSQWYKENFFNNPTKENIIEVFELEKLKKI